MKVGTERFGELEVDKSDIVSFKEGLLGFEKFKNFFVVDPGDQTLILWLQSCEGREVAFPIIEPKIFKPDYEVKLLPAEMSGLGLESMGQASVYCVLTIPKAVAEMSANLKAPIIINNQTRCAQQVVLQNSKLEVCYKVYGQLKSAIARYAASGGGEWDSQEVQTPSQTPPSRSGTQVVRGPNLGRLSGTR